MNYCEEQLEECRKREAEQIKQAYHKEMDENNEVFCNEDGHPLYYNQGSIECWDYMKDIMPPNEYQGYLRGCIIKYVHRCNGKCQKYSDVKKIRDYADEWLKYLTELDKKNE